MKIDIIESKDNPLFDRKDVKFNIGQTGPTPRETEVMSGLAKVMKVDETHIEVDSIHQKYGKLESIGFARVYKKPIRDKKKDDSEEKASDEEKKE